MTGIGFAIIKKIAKRKRANKMSQTNQRFIEELAEFEYRFRDGLVFTPEQKAEIMAICQQIILIAGE